MEYTKRRLDDFELNSNIVVSNKKYQDNETQVTLATKKKKSLLLSPIMLLSGHKGEVFTCKFNNTGSNLASAGTDKQILLWSIKEECENFLSLNGHEGPVMELHWSQDGSCIIAASVDKSVCIWDAATGKRIKKMRGNYAIVNSCCPSPSGKLVISGGDDSSIKIWDVRCGKKAMITLSNKFPVTAVCFGRDDDMVFSGGIDNDLKAWDLRTTDISFIMSGHRDTITGLSLSPDRSCVLSNGMDNSVRVWDIRPFKQGSRMVKVFIGAQHNFEKNLLRCSWSPDGKYVTAGSSDRMVYVWNSQSCKVVYKLPGHVGCVNDVQFHPNEPIIVSASSDKRLYLGELEL